MARLPPGSATYVVFRKRRARHQAISALEFTIAAARYPSIWCNGHPLCERALSAQIDRSRVPADKINGTVLPMTTGFCRAVHLPRGSTKLARC
jgi:hypothetical protein